jgi:hypothetical protein
MKNPSGDLRQHSTGEAWRHQRISVMSGIKRAGGSSAVLNVLIEVDNAGTFGGTPGTTPENCKPGSRNANWSTLRRSDPVAIRL